MPFNVTIPPEKQDKKLLQKLKQELPGILAWAVRGCLEWQRCGLGEPAEVKQATATYKTDMDTLALFLRDCCTQQTNLEAPAKSLYDAFIKWADENGERRMSQRALGLKLSERGFDNYHTRNGWRWIGLGLLERDGCDA